LYRKRQFLAVFSFYSILFKASSIGVLPAVIWIDLFLNPSLKSNLLTTSATSLRDIDLSIATLVEWVLVTSILPLPSSSFRDDG